MLLILRKNIKMSRLQEEMPYIDTVLQNYVMCKNNYFAKYYCCLDGNRSLVVITITYSIVQTSAWKGI